MSITASVTFLLSEQGRRNSRLQGGNGCKRQELYGEVDEPDLECFHVDDEGAIVLDLSTRCHIFDQPVLEFAGRAQWVNPSPKDYEEEIHWDVMPSWDDLLDIARQLKHSTDQTAAYTAEREKEKEAFGRDFVMDSNARAVSIDKDTVKVGEFTYSKLSAVGREASARYLHDQEELKKSNRATLGEWVGQHGTENQRQRLAAGLLPWKEAFSAAEDYLFAPARNFPLYQRFDIEGVCHCDSRAVEGECCSPKFQSVDATELTADEWEVFAKIKAGLPGAQFQLRQHTAQCQSASEPEMRRGVIVKFTMGQLTFRREFALTEVPF